MRAYMFLTLHLACIVLAASQKPSQNLGEYLRSSQHTGFLDLLGVLKVDASKLPGDAAGTLFVPSNAALEAFAKSMGLSTKDLAARPQLVDQIVSYHFMPGYALKDKSDVPANPTIGVTGDVNYILRFSKPGGKLQVQDVQGNTIDVAAEPVKIGKLSVFPVDKVLMSGSYFTDAASALKHYPKWSSAAAAYKARGAKVADEKGSAAGITFFVPSDDAFKSESKLLSSLSADETSKLLSLHMLPSATPITSSSKGTDTKALLAGETLKTTVNTKETTNPWTKEKISRPVVTVAAGKGDAANVNMYNIYAGKDVFHGIDKVLKPSNTKLSGRRLMQSAFAAVNAPGQPTNFAELNSQNGLYSSNPAANFAAQNTASALRAATGGQTRWNSYLWNQGYINNGFVPPVNSQNSCYNCGYFAPGSNTGR